MSATLNGGGEGEGLGGRGSVADVLSRIVAVMYPVNLFHVLGQLADGKWSG